MRILIAVLVGISYPTIAFAQYGRKDDYPGDLGVVLWLLWFLFCIVSGTWGFWVWTAKKTKKGVKKSVEKASEVKTAIMGKNAGEKIVSKFEELFTKYQRIFPHHDPHYHLAMAWSAGILDINKNLSAEETQESMYSETVLPACVPSPTCARALGLYVLYKLNPQIIQKHQVFAMEFNHIMGPVFQAMDDGKLEDLYHLFNPNTAFEME